MGWEEVWHGPGQMISMPSVPPEIVFPAVEEFGREVQERCLLQWARTKTQVFMWEGDLPPETPEGLSLAGEEKDGVFYRSMDCYGVPVGSSDYVALKLGRIAEDIVSDAEKTADLLAG